MGPTVTIARRSWSTTLRVADLGDAGLVLPHRLLEMMQEAAAAVSSDAGYTPDRYREMAAGWVIREVILAIDDVAGYGDAVEVETWISWIRRFRSRREYLVRVGDRVIARGQAEWLFLERTQSAGAAPSFRPRIPDADMFAAFPMDKEVVISSEDVLPLLDAEGPPTDVDERRVEPTEIDGNGHVNNVRYLAWLDDHGRHVRPDGAIVAARLEYLADVRSRDRITLAFHQTKDVDLQFITRGDQRVMRAAVCRRNRLPRGG